MTVSTQTQGLKVLFVGIARFAYSQSLPLMRQEAEFIKSETSMLLKVHLQIKLRYIELFSSWCIIQYKLFAGQIMTIKQQSNFDAATLEQLVANTCFCKLREHCADKNSVECMRHRNIYAEFMLQKDAGKLA